MLKEHVCPFINIVCIGNESRKCGKCLVFSIFVFRHNVFDAEKIESCLKMMEGSHNFRNFCSSTGWIKHLKLPDGSHLSSPRTEEEFIKDISSIGNTS